MEIERKFLVHTLPSLVSYSPKSIIQAYITTNPVIRIRKMDTSYFLTVKSKGHLAHEEFEMPISKEQFESLSTKIEGYFIKKNRYFIPLDDTHTAELDIYFEHLEGLLTVEVEFSSIEKAKSFIPPKWFGEEVTYDSHYKNSYLALHSLHPLPKEEIK